MNYQNPYNWTDTDGVEHSLFTPLADGESEDDRQSRHNAKVAAALEVFPEAQ